MEIYSEREWNETIDWACKIPVLEDNGDLPRRLVVALPKKRGVVSRLET